MLLSPLNLGAECAAAAASFQELLRAQETNYLQPPAAPVRATRDCQGANSC